MKKTRFFAFFVSLALIFSAFAVTISAENFMMQSGDFNGDGITDSKDIILLRRYLANLDYSTGVSSVEINPDANMDGDVKVRLSDLFLLRAYLVNGEFLNIEENNGSASVLASSGLHYTVSDYTDADKNGFSFVNSINIGFDGLFEENFNRFSIKYSSATAVKIFVSYTFEGAAKEDYYFLEAGQEIFSGVILDFLDGKQGSKLTGIKVENLEDQTAHFAVYGFLTEIAQVPERDYYVRGSRYTLGIDLGWGGTINYVSDNQCPISGVENMINKHDTGRLVQQSYYGTGEQEGIDFVWGSFNNNSQWPYNPVQGGGQKNTASRLIDFVVEGDTVYIKVQPMDWGKSDIKYITPSYMENWYIVEDDYIKVDNRFVDFSGWEHGCKGQELPAFYTISYLDSFVWYDGADPWTGDDLSWRHELRFWGDSQYSGECSFRIKEPNTETWCAWVSTEDSYGIGLYSPNIDRYSAGRYQYIETLGVSTGTSGSKDASANSTNYVAPWKQVELLSFKPLEYSYLITTGSVDEIRAIFTENKDVIDNASLSENSVSNRQPYYEENMESIDFTVEGNEKFAVYPNSTSISYDKDMEALKLTVSGTDPHVTFDYSASAHKLYTEDYDYIEIEYMIPAANAQTSYSCQLFICAGTRKSPAESDSVRPGYIKDGVYHILRVKLSDKAYWTGDVNQVRFDYFNGAAIGDVMYIRSVRLCNISGFDLERIDFAKERGASVLSAMKSTDLAFDPAVNATRLTVIGNDPSITVDYTIASTTMVASDYSKLKITYMVPEGQSGSIFSYCIFLCAGDVAAPSPSAQIVNNSGIIADGQYHTIEIDLTQYAFWTGNINMIRFDYFNDCSVGDVFYIADFELVK